MEPTPEIVEALAALDAAVKSYTDANAKMYGDGATPFVLTWVMVAEYTSVDIEKDNRTGQLWTTPEGQPASASIGMLTMALNNLNQHTACTHEH